MERLYNPKEFIPLPPAEELEIFTRINDLKFLNTDEDDQEITQLRNMMTDISAEDL